jgi:DNA-binding MarR family transcriptional regulator
MRDLSREEYRSLAEFRYEIRRFLHFSEERAREQDLEPQQHQLLLAIKALPDGVTATVGELAARLQLKHHSAVELADRLEKHGYVARGRGGEDRRQVILHLTASGRRVLRRLSVAHHEELETAGPALSKALQAIAAQHNIRRRRQRQVA